MNAFNELYRACHPEAYERAMKEKTITDIIKHYNDWTRGDLQAYIEAQYPLDSDIILAEIDRQLAQQGAGI